jgi:hydrogenase-4 component B
VMLSADTAPTNANTEVGRWMLLPMGLHALGVVVLGVAPVLGFMLVRGPTEMALASLPASGTQVLTSISDTLSQIGVISGALLAFMVRVVSVWWLRAKTARRPAARHVTWVCGYGSPNPRMQYTGASFSSDFSARFSGVLGLLRRQKAPKGYFPSDAYVITDCVDAVERRLFSVIGHGDTSASDLSSKLREDDPRIAFAAALVALVVIAGLVVLAGGPLR